MVKGTGEKTAPKPRARPSRQWSCAELAAAHQGLLDVKRESEAAEELERKIKEPKCLV